MIQSLYRQQIADLYSRNCLSFQKLNCTFCKYSKIDTETCDFISAEILSREACHWVKKSLKSASHIASCWTKVHLRGHFASCTYVFADQVDIAFVIRMFCFELLTSTWTKACKFIGGNASYLSVAFRSWSFLFWMSEMEKLLCRPANERSEISDRSFFIGSFFIH